MVHYQHLISRFPRVSSEELLDGLKPSERFDDVSFDNYLPDPYQPSQAAAVETLKKFAERIEAPAGAAAGLFSKLLGGRRRNKIPKSYGGIYLDGGFGVGKTHLLASLWHRVEGPKAFGTFVEYTNLVGALTFRKTVEALGNYRLICIDEFELDDPGDTVLMSRLMRELSDSGVGIAATSNTLPGALGEGRFAAADFQREIQVLADRFTVLRVEGEDFRHRDLPSAPKPVEPGEEEAAVKGRFIDSSRVSLDNFSDLLEHLSRVHPSRYRFLVEGLDGICLKNVQTITQQAVALRFVVLADRLYDLNLPLIASGVPFDRVFTAEMMSGGYQKKYLRAVSRLTALAREGQQRNEPR